MFLFDFLFGTGGKAPAGTPAPAAKQPAAPAAATAPGTRIGYDANLIPGLLEDHRRLVDIFTAIDKARAANDLLTAQARLDQFRMALTDHLLKENVRLYVYLEHALAGDATSHALMHEFRHEMDGIGKVVIGFLGKYAQIGNRPDLAADFGRDLAAIGKALTTRIQREEGTLYPMYAPAA